LEDAVDNNQIATHARELSQVEDAIAEELRRLAEARTDCRERVASHRTRARELLDLISGRTGAQLDLLAVATTTAAPFVSSDRPRWATPIGQAVAYHLWPAGSSEAACGETCDGELEDETVQSDPDTYCLDCAAKARSECLDQPPSVHPLPMDGSMPMGRGTLKSKRKARRAKATVCLIPGCGLAILAPATFCGEHVEQLSDAEREAIQSRAKKVA
jgi:hypothetical protein